MEQELTTMSTTSRTKIVEIDGIEAHLDYLTCDNCNFSRFYDLNPNYCAECGLKVSEIIDCSI